MRPSQILEIKNSYDAFCFDEACEFIQQEVEDGKKPNWNFDKKKKKVVVKDNQKTLDWVMAHNKPL